MPVRPATHRASAQARRAQLLEAAIEVIAEQGFAAATHRAVAARAGLPPSTTTYFFASIDDLLAEALHLVADRTVARVEALLAEVERDRLTATQALERFSELAFAGEQNEIVAQFEIYLECARRPGLQAAAHHIMTSVTRAAEVSLRAMGVRQPAARATLVVAVLDGLALHRRAWPRGAADRRLVGEALTALYEGFVAVDAADRG